MSGAWFRFWQRWLLGACVSTVGLGLLLAFTDTRFVPLLQPAINETFWGTETMPANVVPYHRFVHAVLGATIASWAAVLAFVAAIPFRARERWAWWCVLVALAVWFPVDTGLSLVFGAWANVIFNLSALLFIGAPLVFTRGAFRASTTAPAV